MRRRNDVGGVDSAARRASAERNNDGGGASIVGRMRERREKRLEGMNEIKECH